MNIPDHISESLETIFWVKILKFFYADADRFRDPGMFLTLDSGTGMVKNRIQDKHLGSTALFLFGKLDILRI
jgi:hypothetical protein